MRLRTALNYYLTNYDIIFTDIIEAIIGKPTRTNKVYNKAVEADKLHLRKYLAEIMTK